MRLVTENVGGNLHEAADTINKWGLADYVLAMESGASFRITVVVFRVPDDFRLGRYFYDRASPQEQAQMVAQEIFMRRMRGEKV